MQGCLKFLAGLTATLFVASAIVALFMVNLAAVATRPETLKAALGDVGQLVQEAAPAIIADTIRQQAVQNGLPPIEIDQQVMGQVMDELIPPEWIAAQTGTAVDAFYTALETGDPAAAQVTLDTTPLIERVRGEPGRQAIAVVVDSLPTCTDSQPSVDLFTGNMELPSCVPPGVDKQAFVTEAHAILVETIDLNPQLVAQAGVITVPVLAQLSPQEAAQFQRLHTWFNFGRSWAWVLWLIPAGCLILIWLLVVRSIGDLGSWWGQPLLIAGFGALLLTVIVYASVTLISRTAVPTPTATLQLPLDQITPRLIGSIAGAWLRRVGLQAGLMFVGGIGLALFGYTARRQNRVARL